jgi:mannose-6-phosphate isomerase-like protein (cupin superfamily)
MKPEEEEKEPKWDRWEKDRFFVRAEVGKYGEIYKGLLEQPRVYKSKEKKWKGGPSKYGKNIVNPQSAKIIQAFETHVDVLAPGNYGQKHGHINSAVFYILNGEGYDVHDGVKHPWKAGDVCIVENMCVHQHFNADPKKEARYVIFKAKPTFIFFHLMFQEMVSYPPETTAPGFEDFYPEP